MRTAALSPLLLLASSLTAQQPVAAVVHAFDRMAAESLWPGFTPATTPLAIYDGTRTWLIRHPAPPPPFAPTTATGLPDTRAMDGRFGEVNANTHVDIAGVPTATLIWPGRPVTPARLAATLLHESFHVYQARAHPGWYGNEATFFTYPVADSTAQRLQRLETEAFRRALLPHGALACWASRAMALREERAARIGADAIAYERGNDLNEGLATWIEWRGWRGPLDSLIPAAGFGPDGVRRRAYAVGPAQAFLLDRLRPRWPAELAADSTLTLDALLGRAIGPVSCRADFTRYEIDSTAALAAAESGRILGDRAALRREFLSRAGWQLEIALPDSAPLWPEQFDPWNVVPLEGGEVLHQRHLRLGNDRGRIDVFERWALTTPAGAHPLFNGVKRLLLAGLPERPSLTIRGDSTLIKAPGIEGAFVGMTLQETEGRLLLHPR